MHLDSWNVPRAYQAAKHFLGLHGAPAHNDIAAEIHIAVPCNQLHTQSCCALDICAEPRSSAPMTREFIRTKIAGLLQSSSQQIHIETAVNKKLKWGSSNSRNGD